MWLFLLIVVLVYVLFLSKQEAFSVNVDTGDFTFPKLNIGEKWSAVKNKVHKGVDRITPFKPQFRKFIRKIRTGK